LICSRDGVALAAITVLPAEEINRARRNGFELPCLASERFHRRGGGAPVTLADGTTLPAAVDRVNETWRLKPQTETPQPTRP
jgi:hypothetical protein